MVVHVISEEIDDDLLAYIDSLIKKEVVRASGPSILMGDERLSEVQMADIERTVVGTQKDALSILRMVERRLVAQVRAKDRNDIQLLAKLINESDAEVIIVVPASAPMPNHPRFDH